MGRVPRPAFDQAYEMPTLPLFDDPVTEGPAATIAPPAPAPVVTPEEPEGPEVEVRVSRRRKKSAVSYWEDGRIVVVLPSHVTGDRRRELVDWLVERAKSRRPGAGTSDEALLRRATELADRYLGGVRPHTVRWVTNQHKRWGSCTAETGEIRLSHRLRDVPAWVLDAVLVHELAHLVHPDHSPRFHQLADRYPRQADASIFLEGYSHGLERT